MPTTVVVDDNGYPVPPGNRGGGGNTVSVDDDGYAPGSVAQTAKQRLPHMAPPAEEGPFRRFLQGYGIPTHLRDINPLNFRNPVEQFADNPSITTAMGVLAPPLVNLGMVPADIAEKNYAGAAGRLAQTATTLAPGLKKLPSTAEMQPVYGPPESMASPTFSVPFANRLPLAWRAFKDLPNPLSAFKVQKPTGQFIPTADTSGAAYPTTGGMPPPSGMPLGVNKPPVNNPQGMAFAAGPGGGAYPVNWPAIESTPAPPAAVVRSAITQNAGLQPGTELPMGRPFDPGLQAQGIPQPPPVPSPASSFTPQAYNWLQNVLAIHEARKVANQALTRKLFNELQPEVERAGGPNEWLKAQAATRTPTSVTPTKAVSLTPPK